MSETMSCRVLLLYKAITPSVRLCGLMQLEKLSEDGKIAFRHKRLWCVKKEDLNWADLVVLIRGDSLTDECVAKICRRSGKHVMYVLDDDLLNVPVEMVSGTYYARDSVRGHIRRILECSDCFASPSPALLAKYGEKGKHSFLLVEPAAYCLEEKPLREDEAIRIGFSGSLDRGEDVDRILSEALTAIQKRYGERIRLEFLGAKTKIAEKLECRTYPYMASYEEYQAMMTKLDWDIGLAPMPRTAFHSCKHYNKLVEYCGFGIVGVYSDLPPYQGAVEDGVTGLLCANTAEDWEEAISKLIEEEDLRKAMARNCLELARGAFSVEVAAERMAEGLAGLEFPAETKKIYGCLPWIKARDMLERGSNKLKLKRAAWGRGIQDGGEAL